MPLAPSVSRKALEQCLTDKRLFALLRLRGVLARRRATSRWSCASAAACRPAGARPMAGRRRPECLFRPVHPCAGGRAGEDRPRRGLLTLAQKPVWPPAVTLSPLRPCEHGLPEAMGGNILPGFQRGSGGRRLVLFRWLVFLVLPDACMVKSFIDFDKFTAMLK